MLSRCLLVPSTSPLSWRLHGRQAQIRTETATGPCAGDMLFTHQKSISRVCIRKELSFPTGLLQTCLLFPKEPRFPQTVGLPPITCFRLRLAKPQRQLDRWADSPPPTSENSSTFMCPWMVAPRPFPSCIMGTRPLVMTQEET